MVRLTSSETRYHSIRKDLAVESELRKKAESRVTEILELMLEKNNEIDELKDTVFELEQVNQKLNDENEDLNKEALDLENKIHLMDKMYQHLQREQVHSKTSMRDRNVQVEVQSC